MFPFLQTCLDHFFPPRITEHRIRALTISDIHELILPTHRDTIHACAAYRSPHIHDLIHELKFHRSTHAARLLAYLVEWFLLEHTNNIDAIIPVPLSKKRRRERGHNQIETLLTHVNTTVPILRDCVVRTKHTTPQTSLDRAKRLQNLHECFAVQHPTMIHGKHILILDDVTTTGATLRAIAGTLIPYRPASLTLLALAH